MRRCSHILLITILLLAGGFHAVAQSKSLIKAEAKLVDFYKGIYEDGTRLKNPRQKRLFLDSLEPVLEKRMLELLAMPGAAGYSFDALKKKVRIVGSADKRLRFFSWNTEMGDAKNYIQAIAQYKDDEGAPHIKLLKPFGQDSSFDQAVDYWMIINLSDRSYLVYGDGKYSSQDRSISIANFSITNGELSDTAAIFDSEQGATNVLSIGYSIQVCDAGDIKISYDDEAGLLCYSETVPIARDKIIGRCASGENICLLYNGNIFRRIK